MTRRLYGHVLDAGCGNGEYSRLLGTAPDVQSVTSLDIAFEPFAHGRRYRENCPDGKFVQGAIEDLTMFADKTFDCTICWHTIEHCVQPEQAIWELTRVTKGLVMFALPIKGHGAWLAEGHLNFWDTAEFRALCEKYGLLPVMPCFQDSTESQNWLMERRSKGLNA